MKLPLTAFLFIIPILSFGQKESETTEFMKYEYLVEKQYSEYFKEERTIKIYLPENYNKDRKHPVIYTLDGYELFEITTNYIRFLSKYDVLPNCIVVGIYHNDRNYETKPNYGYDINISTDKFLEGSEKLKNYLFKELISFINLKYHTSGYNVLIGHSNTATFANQIIVEKENPFRGFIAITPDLLDEQINYLGDCLKNKELKKMYYFVSSGKKDDKYRLETGMKLDTIFKANTIKSFKGIHKIYNAGHLDIVAKSLNDALMFVFSDYRNFNDFQEKVIENKSTIHLYLQEKFTFTNENYGIKSKLNENDYLFLMEIVSAQKNKELLEQVLEIGKINTFYPDSHLYSDKAQYYESAGFYEESLKNWKLQIENGFNDNVFYYERPFKLIYYKLDEPKEAIAFLEYSIEKYPKGKLIFNYYIAKVCAEKEIMKEKGLKSINYCIKEFNENRKFNLSSAEEIRKLLNK
ncbi:MAG: hypothetical protein K8R54_10770 [Bacteroidales bacterium]|nr:hypothetical protein [Bacteroidales bacterium]